MITKAIMTQRSGQRTEMAALSESNDAQKLKLSVESTLPYGTLIKGEEEEIHLLENQGYRIKFLPDSNILAIGNYKINTEEDLPKVPSKQEIPKSLAKTWQHHLVQLIAPPNEDWIKQIEAEQVEVIEPISQYGLFVVGSPEKVESLKKFDFVSWVGGFKPAYRIAPNLKGLKGMVNVSIEFYPYSELANVEKALSQQGIRVISTNKIPTMLGNELGIISAEVEIKSLPTIALLSEVRWIEHDPIKEPIGEREVQILAENLNGAAVPAPVTGYQAWLGSTGLSGNGLTIAICDTGVDANANNNAIGHTDLRGRQTAFIDYSGGVVTTDTDGHGTHVAGTAVGNAATGQTEALAPSNFLWGQGVAPQSNFITQNFLLASPQPSTTTLIRDAVNNGANVMNNSWGINDSGGSGYTSGSRTIDAAVRDPNTGAAGLENMTIVCAAGNAGGRNTSIGSPHETKNDIVVGNSLTSRPGSFPSDDIRGISGTSSRGPAVDGRILPTVVAPGTDVSAAFSRTSTRVPIPGTGTPDPLNPANLVDQYILMSGTSMASPHVSGVCALLYEWWRARSGGRNPSPAIIKALLINGAEDLSGGENWRCLNRVTVDKSTWSLQSGFIFRRNMTFVPNSLAQGNTLLTQVASLANLTAAGQWFFDTATNLIFVWMNGNSNPGANSVPFLHARDSQNVPPIPNGHQGWGRVSLQNMVLQAPASDRGPKIFSDQRHAFTAAGQEHNLTVSPVSTARPLRITLVWTDAAGAAGANPALVNDLDLEVREVATGNIYRGNVFNNGFSVTGGTFDDRNNIECVYIRNPSGLYEISIIAATLAASANPTIATPWQDFALVIDNAEYAAASPVNIVPVIDRSASMTFAGYVDITRTSSRQFVDLMNINDSIGIVSFGDTAVREYPAAPVLQTITGQPIRDAARTEIDNILFNGCTFMGGGINEANTLLSTVSGTKAMVLLSDGYDNGGCNPLNPTALDAVAGLPADVSVYTCAMGPLSDQNLLEQIATSTGGRYYFMPTIDDLFEIYNYIRGQVSGDSLIVNESAMASNSRVAGFVDALASEVTFSVSWANTSLNYVPRDARRKNEISVRLRDPRGRLLPDNDSYVKRTTGRGYVIFKIADPIPGQWYVEVSTNLDTHTRYTVGGFVNSPIKLKAILDTKKLFVDKPFAITASIFDKGTKIDQIKGAIQIANFRLGVDSIWAKYKNTLDNIKPDKVLDADGVPTAIGKIFTLRDDLLIKEKVDIFAVSKSNVKLIPDNLGNIVTKISKPLEKTSHNIVVNVTGSTRQTKFVRKDLISVPVD